MVKQKSAESALFLLSALQICEFNFVFAVSAILYGLQSAKKSNRGITQKNECRMPSKLHSMNYIKQVDIYRKEEYNMWYNEKPINNILIWRNQL